MQIKGDGKSYKFASSRAHKAHLLKRNPRNISWTVLYRRKHKKGLEEDVTKKRTRRAQKFQRAVVGATLQDIMAKRNQKPEVMCWHVGAVAYLMMTKPHMNVNHVQYIHSYSDLESRHNRGVPVRLKDEAMGDWRISVVSEERYQNEFSGTNHDPEEV